MHTPFPLPVPWGLARQALLLAALASALPVLAQTPQGSGNPSTASWWRPGSGQTALGLNLGRSRFHVGCVAGYPCDLRDTYFSLYGRNMVNERWGSQLALVHLGDADRAGGRLRAYGLDLSVVGQVPLTQSLGVFGRIGAIYGHTRASTAPATGIDDGTDNGFGLSLGAGVSWAFNPRMAAVLEWDRYDLPFAGLGREGVRATSLGLQWRY